MLNLRKYEFRGPGLREEAILVVIAPTLARATSIADDWYRRMLPSCVARGESLQVVNGSIPIEFPCVVYEDQGESRV